MVAESFALVWIASGVIVHQPSERACREQALLLGDHVRCITVRPPCCCGGAVPPVAPPVPVQPLVPWQHQRGEAPPPVALPPVAHAQPIPEPGSLALLAAGIVALAMARRG